MHCYVRWQVMCTFLEANNVNAFAMLCKFLDPTMEKPQDRVIDIYGLSADKQSHACMIRHILLEAEYPAALLRGREADRFEAPGGASASKKTALVPLDENPAASGRDRRAACFMELCPQQVRKTSNLLCV